MNYPLGIQTFTEIREEKLKYVDKTQSIYTLISGGKNFFLSRPRRFGKSLLISTLESLFLGQKHLFEGLYIAQTDYEFTPHPVVTLEFSKVKVDTEADLKGYIINATNQIAKSNQISLTIESYEQRFEELIRKLEENSGQKVVVLIDEYDKPILDNLFSPELDKIKTTMSAFYAMVKSLDRYLKFVFITGVSKFAKVSVFSGMNNLTDISMDKEFATLCGITQNELEQNFDSAIDQLAVEEESDRQSTLEKVKRWYNGYRFHHKGQSVYNPYSLLRLFKHLEFDNYWYSTATPTFLLQLLKENQYDLQNLSTLAIGKASFESADPKQLNLQSLFFQTGYLTIKAYKAPLYEMDFPNFEVEKSFYDSVVGVEFDQNTRNIGEYVEQPYEHS